MIKMITNKEIKMALKAQKTFYKAVTMYTDEIWCIEKTSYGNTDWVKWQEIYPEEECYKRKLITLCSADFGHDGKKAKYWANRLNLIQPKRRRPVYKMKAPNHCAHCKYVNTEKCIERDESGIYYPICCSC